jgi:uncharacterized protein YmfQ (DUF2313 family)
VLAERAFRDALEINPNYKDALKKWLAVYPMDGTVLEVKKVFDRYLSANPKDKEVIALREEFFSKRNESIGPLEITLRENSRAAVSSAAR